MNYVGPGQGGYVQDTGYRYVGYGGDYSGVRPRRDFTCLICLLSLLLLIPLLCWLFWPATTDCMTGFDRCQMTWSTTKQSTCCAQGQCCLQPPAQNQVPLPVAPVGPVDPYNCGEGFQNWEAGWSVEKKKWCCKVHHRGCPANGQGWEAVPATQYDCNAGFANFVKGWSNLKKNWCCQTMNKGCIGSGAMSADQAENLGYGAGAQHGLGWAPEAAVHMPGR